MAQVLIVSNRLPVSVRKVGSKLAYLPSIGGLATGLSSYVNKPGNSWIGWPGIASEDITAEDRKLIVQNLAKHNCYPVFLNKRQINDFYNGYSNSFLWPLFHGLPVKHTKAGQLDRWWKTYQEVNNKFAKALAGRMQSDSRVWVHDYQLMLLPKLLRKKSPDLNIGFFLHIPFPDIKSSQKFKQAKALMNGMLGADLIGFHTSGYLNNFLNSCRELEALKVANNIIYLGPRAVQLGEFPMGIDYDKYSNTEDSDEVGLALSRFSKKYADLKLIVSIDRLDPTKGLVERLNAYDELLKRNPRYHGKVVFIMVAAPSRTDIAEYKDLARQLGLLSKKINRTYGSKTWRPIDYIDVSVSPEEVTALFQIADIAFIVPVVDGMNLVAKEFVASNKKHGVLILSETAGAAKELKDAIIVNPKDREQLVVALEQALVMRKPELMDRLNRMKQQVSTNTVHHWARSFIDSLQQTQLPYPNLTKTINSKMMKNLSDDFSKAKKRLLLLDYDGTLVPFTGNYKHAVPPKNLLTLLDKLGSGSQTDVVIASGRTTNNMEAWFSGLNVSLVAEHGMAVKKAGSKTWTNLEKIDSSWKKRVHRILERYTRLAPGSSIEIKSNSLAWHYREAKPYQAQKYSVVIKKALKPLLSEYGLEIMQGSKVIEVKNPKISKGNAVAYWLSKDYEFVLAVGDDITDETVFQSLPPHSYGIKVGRGWTSAKLRLRSSESVLRLLNQLPLN